MAKRVQIAIVLLVCASLIVGCAVIPWSGKRGPSALAEPGSIEAQAVSASNTFAYLRQGDVWLAPAAGGEPVRITSHGRAWGPAISPDAGTLVYVLAPATESDSAELWSLELETGESRLLVSGAPPWGAPAFSPDGARLAWPAGDDLLVLDATDGTVLQSLATVLPDMARPDPVWSADGATVYTTRWMAGELALWALPVEGDARSILPLDSALPWAAAPAPDAGLTLWHAGELRLLDVAAPGELVSTPDAMGDPVSLSWSPSGD